MVRTDHLDNIPDHSEALEKLQATRTDRPEDIQARRNAERRNPFAEQIYRRRMQQQRPLTLPPQACFVSFFSPKLELTQVLPFLDLTPARICNFLTLDKIDIFFLISAIHRERAEPV